MGSLLLAVIYLIFISLGLPDSLLGSGWPKMQMVFGLLQQEIGIGIMPIYLLIFAVMNIGFLELTYKVIKKV